MPYAHNGPVKLYYEDEGQGPAIIFINDMMEDHLFWETTRKALVKHFRVIVFDQRGMGQSSVPKSSFTIENMAEDVLAIADELKLEKFDVVGDSMGGAVAQIVASQFPDRVNKLVLSNSYTHLSQVIKWTLEMAQELFEQNESHAYLYKLMMPWYFSARYLEREDDPHNLLKSIEKRKHPLTYKGFKSLVEAAFGFDTLKLLKNIQCPTLVIIAEDDIFSLFKDSRQMIKGIPIHQVELISGGHNSKLEHPNRYSELLRVFFTPTDDQ